MGTPKRKSENLKLRGIKKSSLFLRVPGDVFKCLQISKGKVFNYMNKEKEEMVMVEMLEPGKVGL